MDAALTDYREETKKNSKIMEFLRASSLALFLFSLTVGVQAGKVMGTPIATGAATAGGMLCLFVLLRGSGFFKYFLGSMTVIIPAIGLILITMSALYAFEISPIMKSFLLIGLFYVVASRAPSLSTENFLTGLLMFAVLDVLFVVVTRSEWNPNALCNHISFASLCGMAGSLRFRGVLKYSAVLWFLLGVGITYYLGSRTAVVGLMASLGLFFVVRKGRVGRFTMVVIFVLGATLAVTSSGDIIGGLRRVARKNLGSQNIVAKFFLNDKTRQSVNADFFDRKRIWDIAYKKMMRNPVLGIGYGQPLSKYTELRAHNAYLEVGYQCGIFAMITWTIIYLGFLDYSMTRVLAVNSPVAFIAFTSSCYLVLAGLMESSGVASIAVPGNWIAVSAVSFLKCDEMRRKTQAGESEDEEDSFESDDEFSRAYD